MLLRCGSRTGFGQLATILKIFSPGFQANRIRWSLVSRYSPAPKTEKNKNRFPSKNLSIISDPNTVFSMSNCPGAVSMLRSYKQEASKHQWPLWVTEWCSVKGQKKHVRQDFLQGKEVLAEIEKKKKIQCNTVSQIFGCQCTNTEQV